MFHNDLVKLRVTLVLLVATAFVSVAAVAADDSGTIRLIKTAPDSPDLDGAADDWFQRHPDTTIPGDPATEAMPLQSTLDPARLASLTGGRSAGSETVSAAGAWWSYYGPPADYGSGR